MSRPRLSTPRSTAHMPPPPPARPVLAEEIPLFMRLEREVEDEFRPRMLESLQQRLQTVSDSLSIQEVPTCLQCDRPMCYHDSRPVSWMTRFGKVKVGVSRYRCKRCRQERRPLIEKLGVEPGRISGSLARLLALLGVVVPYELAAHLAWVFFGSRSMP